MADAVVLREIKKMISNLRENARMALYVEALLREKVRAWKVIGPLHEKLRERQRDFACMIRMAELVEKTFVDSNGLESRWMPKHRELWRHKQRFDRKYRMMDVVISRLVSSLDVANLE